MHIPPASKKGKMKANSANQLCAGTVQLWKQCKVQCTAWQDYAVSVLPCYRLPKCSRRNTKSCSSYTRNINWSSGKWFSREKQPRYELHGVHVNLSPHTESSSASVFGDGTTHRAASNVECTEKQPYWQVLANVWETAPSLTPQSHQKGALATAGDMI